MQYTLVGNEAGESNITVFVEGQKPLAAHSSHPKWDDILKGVMADDENVYGLFDVAMLAGQKFEKLSERVAVANGRVFFDGDELDGALSETIVRFVSEGVKDWKPLVNFFENVMQNPNEHSREQLYGWVKNQNISITPSGMLVGYKGVNEVDGKLVSNQSGTAIVNGEVVKGQIPNKVGSVVEMPRTEVMHNPRADCDAGLHVGSYDYAKGYAPVLLEVHVNPRDVVSVPDSSWKLRTCRYTVVKVIKKPITKAVRADAKTKAPKDGEVRATRPGDVFEDTDKRRAGRKLTVEQIDGEIAVVKSNDTGVTRAIKLARLNSRKYRLVQKSRRRK